MAFLHKKPDTREKLKILSDDSKYDLACACGMNNEDRRKRGLDNRWIYPVSLPQGGYTFLFKTLLSNQCSNNCHYCPLRSAKDFRRCVIQPEELAKTFLDYHRTGRVNGLFLSSGVLGTADKTMTELNKTAHILRKKGFKGYLHLKIIPGASDAAIRETVSLASAVSINIETAGVDHFKKLGADKNYLNDIIRPLKLISQLTAKGERYARVKQTTQFIVGAADETDQDIVKYSWGLYKRLGLSRIYFSAYQRGLGDSNLPGETSRISNADLLTREHRLYQVDWLIRKYKFSLDEIPFEQNGNLSLTTDPKELWAIQNPQFFPININRADPSQLFRIPGFGEVMVKRIMNIRKQRSYIRSLEDLGKIGKLFKKTQKYVTF